MRKCVLLLLAIGAVQVSSAAAEEKAAATVPQILQGDWLVPSKPSPNSFPGMRMPDFAAITLRITAINYVARTHKDSSILGAWEESGEPVKLVKDADGKEYFEEQPFFLTIRTNTVPWQIDLWRKAGDGKRLEKKGICLLQENTLTLCLSTIGGPRPTSFDAAPGVYVMKATRTGKPTVIPLSTEKGPNAQAAVIGKVTVTAEQAPVMQGKEAVLTAKRGDVFGVTQIDGDWYGVLPSRGWIHKANVRYEASLPLGAVQPTGSSTVVPAASAAPPAPAAPTVEAPATEKAPVTEKAPAEKVPEAKSAEAPTDKSATGAKEDKGEKPDPKAQTQSEDERAQLNKEAEQAFAQGKDYFIWPRTKGPFKRDGQILAVPFDYFGKENARPYRLAFALVVNGKELKTFIISPEDKSRQQKREGQDAFLHIDFERSLSGKGKAMLYLVAEESKASISSPTKDKSGSKLPAAKASKARIGNPPKDKSGSQPPATKASDDPISNIITVDVEFAY
jgi:uncharacterized protein (TIGR03067 family)